QAYLPLAVATSPGLAELGAPGQVTPRAEQAVNVERQLQSTYTSYTFEGCYVDDTNRALDDFFQSDEMTPELCFGYCRNNGYAYMGLQYGNECYCGSLGDEEKHVRYGPGDCNFLCAGDDSFNCGGMWAFDLYSFETASSEEGVGPGVDSDGDGTTTSDGSTAEDDFWTASSTGDLAGAPAAAPVAAPVTAPSAAPVAASTAAPVTSHTAAPATDATTAPTADPSPAPVVAPMDDTFGDFTDDDANGDDTTDDDAPDVVEDDDADVAEDDDADGVADDDADVVADDDADGVADDDADVVADDDADGVADDDSVKVADDDSAEGVDDDADKAVDDDAEVVEEDDDSYSGDGECSPNPCLNGGSCKVDPNGGYVCSCAGSYGGMVCETDTTGLPEFFITLEFDDTWDGALDATRKGIFQTAANRWEKVVTHIPCTETNPEGATGELIITITLQDIDGAGGQFALGGPSDVYGDCPGVSYLGVMIFDSDDIDDMEDDGILEGLVVHEMGHVIGIG
ncbi:unnamed protein product, partial [Ectocarpus fasciculatus]